MVINRKILEKGMGNRGSKSNYTKFVKEQRVDCSYIGWKTRPMLRYTLRGFERITFAGILSNQILNNYIQQLKPRKIILNLNYILITKIVLL